MAKITYNDKVALIENADIPDVNKVKADDMNEIKSVVNENAINISTEVDEDYRVNLLHSKNLFDKDNIDGYVGLNATLTTISNGVRATATTTGQYLQAIVIIKDATNMVGESVSVKGNFTASSSNTGRITIGLCDSAGGNRKGLVHITTSGNSGNATIPSISGDVKYLFIAFYANNDGTGTTKSYVDYTNVMLNLGSTALPYEPFMQNSMQVDGTKFTDTINVGSLVDNRNRVNLLHSNNLFDLQNAPTIDAFINGQTKEITSYNISKSTYIPIEPNTTYTITKTKGIRFIVGTATSYSAGTICTSIQSGNDGSATNLTITSGANDRYLIVFYYKSDVDTETESTIRNTIKIVKGSTPTTEPFIQNQIVVDNEKYSDTLNVGASLDSRSRVNVLKSKNLFTTNSVLPNTALNNNVVFSSSEWDIFVIPVEIGTTYTLSKTSYNGGILSFNTTFPKINDTVNNAQTLRNISTLTFEAKDNYLCLMIAKSDDKTTIQVEKGSTATSYSPFIQNKIVVDNEKYSETIGIGTSVDSRNRVNVLKSNQLFNKDSVVVGYINADGSITSSDTNYKTSDFIPVKPNTTYYITASGTSRAKYFNSSKTPLNTSSYQDIDVGANAGSFTTPANCYYIRKSMTNARLNDLMLNEGSTALPYEPYVVPSIYVDNEMLVSKNVYSTGEVVIGEWLGKPLYRKVVEITNPTLDAWTNVNHNISNMDFGRIVDATLTRTIYGTTSYIPIGVSNISAGTLFTCDLQKTIIEYKIAGYTNITKLIAVLEYTKTTD